MAQLKDDGGIGGGGTRGEVMPEATLENFDSQISRVRAEAARLLEGAADPDRALNLEAEIGRLLEGFDDRLAS